MLLSSSSFTRLAGMLLLLLLATGRAAEHEFVKITKDDHMLEHLHEITETKNSFAVAGFFVGAQYKGKEVATPNDDSSDPAFLAFRGMSKDGSWFDHENDGQLDSIAFGYHGYPNRKW